MDNGNNKQIKKTLLITGKLANPSLQQITNQLNQQNSSEQYEICELPITVAALMTPEWITKQITKKGYNLNTTNKIIIPGRCQGDTQTIQQLLHTKTEKGPEDLWDLLQWVGLKEQTQTTKKYNGTVIIGEIIEAHQMTTQQIIKQADTYRQQGATYIDIGGNGDNEIPQIEEKIKALKSEGHLVTIDTFHKQTQIKASKAGADIILSYNSTNADILNQLQSTLVVIPDNDAINTEKWLQSLEKNMEQVTKAGLKAIADPITNPPLMGLTQSIQNYATYRKLHPDHEMLMGCCNITELIETDSMGVNAILAVIMKELNINYALTTDMATWTAKSIKELSTACKTVWEAQNRNTLPRKITNELKQIKRDKPTHDEQTLKQMQQTITDKNWRIFVTKNKICAFNCDKYITGTQNQTEQIYKQMQIEDPSHSYYIGNELQKAAIALQLGRNYVQDQPIDWGTLS